MGSITTGTNTIGAIIFFTYIIAALAFTFVIVKDIVVLSAQQRRHVRNDERTALKSRDARRVSVFSAAALISFSVLSWNMLSFLLTSYAQWAGKNQVVTSDFYTSFRGLRQQAYYIWIWATSSTLFETFAEDLLRDSRTWRWTTLSLLYHYACNIYISTVGHQYRVSHLWVYFVLNQILPISLTQNLFFTNIALLASNPKAIRQPRSAHHLLRLCAVVLYIGLLYSIPSTVQSQSFIPVLMLTRVVLFAPFLLDLVSYNIRDNAANEAEGKLWNSNLYCLLILVAFGASSMWRLLSLNSSHLAVANYAAAALSDDLLIGTVSSLVYKIL